MKLDRKASMSHNSFWEILHFSVFLPAHLLNHECWSDSFPVTTDKLLDLLGLIFIRAHSMFSCNFLRGRLVHGRVGVRVVMSSMYALMGGSHRPGFCCTPPTTHCDARIMTSMVMVKASREMVHPAMMPTSRCCQAVVYSAVVKHSCMSWK